MAKKYPSTSRSCASLRDDLVSHLHSQLSVGFGVDARHGDPRSPLFTKEGYLVASLFSKLPTGSNSAASRKEAALNSFLASDARNARSNERLLWCEGYIHGMSIERILDRARSICAKILGYETVEVYRELALWGSFSGGASTSKRRGSSTAYFKFREQGDITERAMPYLEEYVRDTRYSEITDTRGTLARVVPGNIFFTVPKNAETDRGACKEPDWNMFFQKGIGDYIRACLKRVGCDLDDQTQNQRLAHLGSIDGSLATIDLSAASDSNSISLVERIVPAGLYRVLDDLRSPCTKLPDGSLYETNMFSSMGNGFTFELETLLFLSLARAITSLFRIPGKINVYGDDIIVPTAAVPMLLDLLGFCGHRPNISKTFYTGFFRESCGKHYYHGHDVTPVYVRRPLESDQTVWIKCRNRKGKVYEVKVSDRRRIIHLHNRLLHWGALDGIVDPRLDGVIRELRSMIPEDFWGGRDVEAVDAAVTPHAPRMRYHESYGQRNVSDKVVYLMNLAGSRTESTVLLEGLAYTEIETRRERKLPVSELTSGPGLITSVTPRLLARKNNTYLAKQYTANDIPRLLSEI